MSGECGPFSSGGGSHRLYETLASAQNVKLGSGAWRGSRLLGLAAVAAALVAPVVLAFSGGITKDNAGVADFEAIGCTACHGPGAPHADFAAGAPVTWAITDPEGNDVAGNVYAHEGVYTITITLDEQNVPGAANHAGFNLRSSSGGLAGVEGQSQASADGTQATHTSAARTSWSVQWTAPAEGPAIFDLFVNDVDGSGANDPGDSVHRVGFYLTDESHALPGAAEAEHVEFGITLQQYWIGLIGLFGMIAVMVAGYVYLKFANPHNTDQKDR